MVVLEEFQTELFSLYLHSGKQSIPVSSSDTQVWHLFHFWQILSNLSCDG